MEEKIHEMEKSLKVGEQGEVIILEYLKNHKNILHIKDVRNNFTYRKLDIDFLVDMPKQKNVGIEVKTDSYRSPNIFFETLSCVETDSLGCMRKTKSKFIFYYFLQTKELYILNTKELNIWFDKNMDKFQKKSFKNKRYDGESYYTSEGYTIPKKYLESNFKSYKKYILK